MRAFTSPACGSPLPAAMSIGRHERQRAAGPRTSLDDLLDSTLPLSRRSATRRLLRRFDQHLIGTAFGAQASKFRPARCVALFLQIRSFPVVLKLLGGIAIRVVVRPEVQTVHDHPEDGPT